MSGANEVAGPRVFGASDFDKQLQCSNPFKIRAADSSG
jgi:hypothetical protein